jgi:hypothetical protein
MLFLKPTTSYLRSGNAIEVCTEISTLPFTIVMHQYHSIGVSSFAPSLTLQGAGRVH